MNLPKHIPQRNPHLLRMARKHGCQIRSEPECWLDDTSTTVGAHENASTAGKGGARKADDHRMVYACFWCHTAYDQGKAPQEVKREWFAAAMERQAKLYTEIINSPTALPQDRKAAQWALERLTLERLAGV